MYIFSPVLSDVAAIASRSFLRSAAPARSSESHSTENAVKPPALVESMCSFQRSLYFLARSLMPGMSTSPDQEVVQRTLSASLSRALMYSVLTWPPRMASFLAGLPLVAPSSFTYVSRSRAYDSTMGDVRNVYLKPREVISGSTSVAHTKGTPSRSAIWVATMVAALWLVPVMATQPRW